MSENIKLIKSGNFPILGIKKTQIEMMLDRGYEVNDSEMSILKMNEDDFNIYIDELIGEYEGYDDDNWFKVLSNSIFNKNRIVIGNSYTHSKKDKKCIALFLTVSEPAKVQIGVEVVKSVILLANGYKEMILILDSPLSSKASDSLKNNLVYSKFWIFNDREIFFNPTKHMLVPKHYKLDKENKKEFLKNFKHPQKISEDDIIVKYYGWSKGNIVCIERDIEKMGLYINKMLNKRIIVRANAV
jgi:DNA-directed RNA polymerase subunit H (RpoH/RPB5)